MDIVKMIKHKHIFNTLGLLVFFSFVSSSQAAIPVFDATAVLQIIKQGIQEAQQFEQNYNLGVKQLTLSGLVGDRNIQNENNIAANTIMRLTQNESDIANNVLARESRSAISACNSYNIANALNGNICVVQSMVKDLSKKQAYLSQGGDLSKPYPQSVAESVNQFLAQQQQLAQETQDSNAGLSSQAFLHPSLGGYTQTEQKEADLNRQLILSPVPVENPIPVEKRSQKNLPFVQQQERVNLDIYTARKNVAATFFLAV